MSAPGDEHISSFVHWIHIMPTWLQHTLRLLLKGKDGSWSGWEIDAKVWFLGISLVQNAVLAFTILIVMWCLLHVCFGQFCESKALCSHSTTCAHSCSVFIEVKVQWLLRWRWALLVHDCDEACSKLGCNLFAFKMHVQAYWVNAGVPTVGIQIMVRDPFSYSVRHMKKAFPTI